MYVMDTLFLCDTNHIFALPSWQEAGYYEKRVKVPMDWTVFPGRSDMQRPCYITSVGQFLPGEPVGNDQMEAHLGQIGSKPSALRTRVLRQNGIMQRYYAIDAKQRTLFTNTQMAAYAVREALAQSSLDLKDIELLVAATSQGDLPLPGFASMVQGELKMPTCEVATLHGICASSVIGLRHGALAIGAGEVKAAMCVASEFVSRLLKASRFQAQGYGDSRRLPFETEFLRWMLSDGAGALLLQEARQRNAESPWRSSSIVIKSYAGDFPPCMFVGNRDEVYAEPSVGWLDHPDYEAASAAGAINLHQSVDLLKEVVRLGVNGVFEMIEAGQARSERESTGG